MSVLAQEISNTATEKTIVLVLTILAITAVVLYGLKRARQIKAEQATRKRVRESMKRNFEPPARETRPAAPLLSPRQETVNREPAFPPKTPHGSRRLRDDDITTSPTGGILGGSLYAAPAADPLDRDAGTSDAYSPAVDSSPSPDSSPSGSDT